VTIVLTLRARRLRDRLRVREALVQTRDKARAEVRDLLTWQPVPVDVAILERGWKVQDRYQLSYWDALIVAAAKSVSCRYLLTEDLQAGQDVDGVIVVNPFLNSPASLSQR
jgi:predicted nucleic acid-binding protein